MPKGTVVTLPASAVPAVTLYPDRPVRKQDWASMAGSIYFLLASAVYRDNLLINGIAFLLSRVSIMGELAPFGLAFFAAVAQVSKGRAAGNAIWAILGVLSVGRYAEAGIYLFAILLYFRLVDKLTQFQQKLQAVPLFVFVAVTVGGMPLVLWHNATLYHVMLVIFDALTCMVLTYIYMSGAGLLVRRAEPRQVTGEILTCLVIVLATAVAGTGTAELAGYSVRNIMASFIVMTLALAGGSGLGTSVGVAVGLAVGLADDNATTLISLYAIAGLLAGTFRSLGKFAVILGFMIGSVITVLHFGQASELVQVLTEAAVAAGVLMLTPMAWILRWSGNLHEYPEERETAAQPNEAIAKLASISEIFDSLAAASGQVSADAAAQIREAEITRHLSTIGEQVCGPCQRRAGCWDHDYHRTYQAMLDALALAERVDLVNESLPKPLRQNCVRGKELTESINSVAHYNRNSSYLQKKIAANRQTVTEQLKAVGSIVSNLAASLRQMPPLDQGEAVSIKEKAELIGCPLDEVKVRCRKGVTTVEVSKNPCSGNRECINSILPLAANILRRKIVLHAECGNACQDKRCRLSLEVAGSFGVQTGIASAAKEPHGVCGDTATVVTIDQRKVALILSDGMGSGTKAAGESSTAVRFLERLLGAGFTVDVAVKTVNYMLLLKDPEESFATIDMMVIDTCAGEAEFIKVGSALSFVKRVREVTTVKSAALPIGILHQIEIEPIRWALAAGDIIVMASDGIVDLPCRGSDRESWLATFLRLTDDAHPQAIADSILRQAKELAGPNIRDDMTVVVARITERPSLE